MWLTASAAILLAIPLAAFASEAFVPGAEPTTQGALAALALFVAVTLASMLVGVRSPWPAFVLRASAAVLVVPVAMLIGRWATPLLLMAAVVLVISVLLLAQRLRRTDERRPRVTGADTRSLSG